jgi:hypothetical protein
MVSKVKGDGILLADLVCSAVFTTTRGEPNMATQNNKATFPMTEAGSFGGKIYTNPKVPAITVRQTFTCCQIEPGRVADLAGAYLTNFKK